MKTLLPFASVLSLIALRSIPTNAAPNTAPPKSPITPKTGVSQTAKTPAQTGVLQQVKSGPLTIRLRRARWAESEEVLAWRNRGKQLTLWFDAVLNPQITLPKGTTPADYIVNVRLLDEQGKAVQVFPVDLVRSLHRPSLPYVPAKRDFKFNGQSVWRATPFNPNFNAVKLQIEWLRPGHPFNRKTMPPSILDETKPATDEARQWLQKLELDLPAQQVEYGAVSKSAPIAQAENERFKAILQRWIKGSATTTSGEGAGTSRVYFEATLLLRATDPSDRSLLLRLEADFYNQAGEKFAMQQNIGEEYKWFAPDGKPLKANERVLSGSFYPAPPLDENSKWSLQLQPYEHKESLTLRDLPLPPGYTGTATK